MWVYGLGSGLRVQGFRGGLALPGPPKVCRIIAPSRGVGPVFYMLLGVYSRSPKVGNPMASILKSNV